MRAHGQYVTYRFGPDGGADSTLGCHCPACSLAASDYERRRKARTAPPYVDASRARAHVKSLMDAGFGFKSQAEAAGLSQSAVGKLIYGDTRRGQAPTKRIRPDTEKALLGLTLDQAPDQARTITADRYNAALDELHRRGWTYTQIAERVGCAQSNLRPRRRTGQTEVKVTAGRYRAVQALLDEHPPLIGADDKGHNAAAVRRANAWDPEAERRDRLRKAAQVEHRAHYRAINRGDREVSVPTLDLAALAAQEWRHRSACRFVPDAERWIFWALEADTAAMDACRKVCSWCPVAGECLAEALRSGESGFWGGMSEGERRALVEGARIMVRRRAWVTRRVDQVRLLTEPPRMLP